MGLLLTAVVDILAVALITWRPQLEPASVFPAAITFVAGFMAHYAWKDTQRV